MADLAVDAMVLAAHILLPKGPSCSVGVDIWMGGRGPLRNEVSRVKEHCDMNLSCMVANDLQPAGALHA